MKILLMFAFSSAVAAAQQSADPAPLDRMTAVMRDYARGMTENRFDAQCKISQFDSAGKLRRTRNTTHVMEFTKGRYRGLNETADSDWTGTINVRGGSVMNPWSRSAVRLELYTDQFAFQPVFVFAPSTR